MREGNLIPLENFFAVTLEETLDEWPETMTQVAEAIHHCHEHGILHRDLKPANILVRASDGKPFVTDFGLVLDESIERMTKTGALMGTPAYMPPEQAEGDKQAIDRRTDVYALGAVLHHLVTGKPPFAGGNLVILKQIFSNEPPALQEARGGRVPPA